GPMRRRTLVGCGLTTTAAAGLGLGSGVVGSADLARLQRNEVRLYRLTAQHGGDMLWQAATSAADEGYAMLERGSYGASVGRQLLIVTGRLQICAGWLAFDAGHHAVAQASNEGALALARQANDAELESQALADLAWVSYVLDRPREAQRLASAAGDVAISARVSARLAAIPQLRRAVASSLMADARGSAQAIRQVRITLDGERDEAVEEWCAFVTPFEVDGVEATCALELGHAARAQRLLEKVVIGYGHRFTRNRALYRVRLARARLDQRELDGAAEAANAVLDDLSGDVASWRVSSELSVVARRLADHPHVEGVGQFLHRYSATSA
ncbi:MAG TPA: hypothetical protein VHH34_12655, partial [Pseudonocardiaceae bacterium]|nr:hypothetical protein [Pseudonocardiaceae bacterium]